MWIGFDLVREARNVRTSTKDWNTFFHYEAGEPLEDPSLVVASKDPPTSAQISRESVHLHPDGLKDWFNRGGEKGHRDVVGQNFAFAGAHEADPDENVTNGGPIDEDTVAARAPSRARFGEDETSEFRKQMQTCDIAERHAASDHCPGHPDLRRLTRCPSLLLERCFQPSSLPQNFSLFEPDPRAGEIVCSDVIVERKGKAGFAWSATSNQHLAHR